MVHVVGITVAPKSDISHNVIPCLAPASRCTGNCKAGRISKPAIDQSSGEECILKILSIRHVTERRSVQIPSLKATSPLGLYPVPFFVLSCQQETEGQNDANLE